MAKRQRDAGGRADLLDATSTALYEFVLLALPVALYVALESHVKGDWTYFFSSPEWAIATIFLAVQAVFLYFKSLMETGRRTSARTLGGLTLVTVVMVVVSAINAVESLQGHGGGSAAARTVRLTLFVSAGVMFFLLVASGRYTYLKIKKD